MQVTRLLVDVPVKNGKLMLPSGSTIIGDIRAEDLWQCDGPRSGEGLGYGNVAKAVHTFVTRLPDHLTIEGSLVLEGCIDFSTLPKGLVVKGSLVLDYAYMKRLPPDLVVEKTLSIAGNDFCIPPTAKIGSVINLGL